MDDSEKAFEEWWEQDERYFAPEWKAVIGEPLDNFAKMVWRASGRWHREAHRRGYLAGLKKALELAYFCYQNDERPFRCWELIRKELELQAEERQPPAGGEERKEEQCRQ